MPLFPFATEDLVDEQNTRILVEPFRKELVSVWTNSFACWDEWPEDHRRRMCETPTARPNAINALAQSFAREFFSDREGDGIEPCEAIPGVFAFYINGKVLVRFNGLNRDFVVSCHGASPLKKLYLAQEPIPKLNNAASRVTCGYTLDASRTMIETVEMSLQVGQDRQFHFQIDGEADAVMPLSSPATPPPLNPPTTDIGIRKPR